LTSSKIDKENIALEKVDTHAIIQEHNWDYSYPRVYYC
jgi:hypothetical protein